ncbi:MAG: FAD-binding oxidoreductase [Actinomycetota bacterium]|nr:FAD-binding oxidoreductase [Actinomycetota bacterium]
MSVSDPVTMSGSVDPDLRKALDAAAGIVGEGRVHARPDDSALDVGPNSGLFRQRDVSGIIRPRTAEEVRQVVEVFGQSVGAGSLHPLSTGRNWGLGSKEPAVDGAIVLDLSDLKAVRDIDIDAGWAVIEPGVSQGHMSELLDGTTRMINVTVSSAHSSVVGNVLDRGVGLRHQRVEDVVGLEVVLPNGELLHVGWWPEENRETAVYAHGLGPSVLPLFTQSNLGVVTAAAIRLLPRPEALRVVRLTFNEDNLGGAIGELRRWRHQGLVSGVMKVYNPAAARGYGITNGDYLAHVCVDGTAAAVEALTTVIVAEAQGADVFHEISATDATDPTAEHHDVGVSVERAYWGDPDITDTLFENKIGTTAAELDGGIGFLFFLPLVPFTSKAQVAADGFVRQVVDRTGVRCGATLNVIGDDLVDYVVSIKFDRETEADAAHRALELLYGLFTPAGFLPYRLDVDHADRIDDLSPDAATRAFVRRLKDHIDPQQAIAPGRYR